jgi:hypothetical protein
MPSDAIPGSALADRPSTESLQRTAAQMSLPPAGHPDLMGAVGDAAMTSPPPPGSEAKRPRRSLGHELGAAAEPPVDAVLSAEPALLAALESQ